jgi:hypothetical protein
MRFLGGKREKINQAKATAIESVASGYGPSWPESGIIQPMPFREYVPLPVSISRIGK